jgi:hypothetical protein
MHCNKCGKHMGMGYADGDLAMCTACHNKDSGYRDGYNTALQRAKIELTEAYKWSHPEIAAEISKILSGMHVFATTHWRHK